jgi:prepilin-type N-terminal cleavage/methylation domain-containing protein
MKAKGIFTHLSKYSANNKGLTLIEVIVSIAIMAIVTGPFLGTIILSTRNNTYSEQVLKSSELAQNVMEEIKSKPDFLEAEAIYESVAPITEYKEYLQEDGYRVRYKIVKREGTVSASSDNYKFEEVSDLPTTNLSFSVDSGSVYLNGISYSLTEENVPENYYLEISKTSGVYNYKFFDEDNSYLQSADLSPVDEAEPIKIKIAYINGCEDIFKLNVNVDNIDKNIIFYTIDDKKDALEINNTGTTPFYQFDEVSSDTAGYYNVLFEIELVVDYKDQELNRVLSYVKKNR